ncbi:uncharacterized protein LDX57_008686 [Aspergillus melleus]|uniref:uncharacterized protein n=1 Tax=Aspergillus melleus TaxID=138277 RepID=UPI001E8CD733|nr:uncharacterized protein LDX57_008686 [Aspergillus melleus]KAH8431025.1 hypothetical protein LDX57_008686 [Aspergillus melleus]
MAPPRDWFAQLEKKVTKVARDIRQKRQIKQLFEAAKEVRKRQKDEKCYPTIPVTGIDTNEVEEFFKLKEITMKDPEAWGIGPDDTVEVPAYLLESMRDEKEIFRRAPNKEALNRVKIDTILKAAWCIKRHDNVQAQLERNLRVDIPIDRPKKTVVGAVDYAVWYGRNAHDQAACICIIEAKKSDQDGFYQALSYMAMILNIRERDGCTRQVVWGIATNARNWCFIRLNPDRTYSSITLSLGRDELPEILTLLAAIMDQAAIISPVSSIAS